jgi:OPT oligopeptide transporter protein
MFWSLLWLTPRAEQRMLYDSDHISTFLYSHFYCISASRPILLLYKGSYTINIPTLSVSFMSSTRSLNFDWFPVTKTDQWLVVMSTQLIGFSIGGLCKRFLVTPSSMIWPKNLATAALINTLHSQETSGSRSRDGISRQRFFTYGTIGYIFYSHLLLSFKMSLLVNCDYLLSQTSCPHISSLLCQASPGSAG